MKTTPPPIQRQPEQADLTERLLAELYARGIEYLSGGYDANTAINAAPRLLDADLLRHLAMSPEARIRNAMIALFLLHPEIGQAIPTALHASDLTTQDNLITLALAAYYLQHLWRTRLVLALGSETSMPDDLITPFIQERNLPSPDELHGELGLRCLQEYVRARSGLRLNYLGDWQDQVNHLLWQETARRKQVRI